MRVCFLIKVVCQEKFSKLPYLLGRYIINTYILFYESFFLRNIQNWKHCFAKIFIFSLFKELKLRLDWLLEYKLSHPGHVSWNDKTSDITLLK